MTEERFIVGLDIGTTKICTVIGEVAGDGVLDIIGEGTVPSDGLRRGVVVNLERTIASVRESVELAQRVAGVQVESVWVGVAGTHLKAFTSHGMAAIRRGTDISASDVERCIENAQAVPIDPTLEILHVLAQEYVVDGNDGIKDPVGMAGVRLEVDVHVVAGAQGPLANLRRCAEDAGLRIDGLVVQSLASGLAVLNRSERELSTIVIDIGGGTTDVGVFRRGKLAHSAVIPLGGDHVTQDISQLLRIAPEEAERVKLHYGAALPDIAQRDLMLEVANANYTASISTVELAQVIKPRVIEILDLVRARIEERMGALELAATHVVLTGGASLMPGIDRLASERYRLPVRIGRPEGVAGLTDVVAGPKHATAVGLVRHGMIEGGGVAIAAAPRREARGGILDGLRRVLKDFF
jgi:cell division protein FtsA